MGYILKFSLKIQQSLTIIYRSFMQDATVLRPMEPIPTVETSPESSILKSQNEDYERISEKSASSSVIEITTAEVNQTENHLSQTQHHYQEINDDTLLSNKQVYQSLERTGNVVAQATLPVAQREYET
jgi:hypothetical protein